MKDFSLTVSGSGSLKIEAPKVDGTLAAQGITPTFYDHVYDGGGNLGGPIFRDRLWFFGSFYKFDQQQSITDFPVPIPTEQWQASVKFDSHLNDNAYILPGLGDAGDRQFGTV